MEKSKEEFGFIKCFCKGEKRFQRNFTRLFEFSNGGVTNGGAVC